jgi:MFS family permease
MLLEGMTSSSINVQIAVLRQDLQLNTSLSQLIVGAFPVGYAGLLPVAGRFVDVWRRRTVFLMGAFAFGVGCAVCAVATSGAWLVVGRFIQGAGGALSAPAALALITAAVPAGKMRHRALGLFAAMGAAGFTLGLVLPGFLVSAWGWRSSFAVYLPVVAIVLLAVRTAPDAPGEGGSVHFLSAGALTLSLMLAVDAVGGIGTQPTWVVGVQLAVAAILGTAVAYRGRGDGPRLFPRGMLRSARLLAACTALAGVFAAIVTSMYLLALGLYRHHDALAVGLALIPQSISNACVTVFGARLVTRYGAERILVAGMSMIAAALVYLGTWGFSGPYLTGMLPGLVVIGCGVALCYPASAIMAVDTVTLQQHGSAAGLLTTFQNMGGATGLAIATAAGVVPASGYLRGARPGMYLSAGFLVVAASAAFAASVRARQRQLTVVLQEE